MNPRNRLSGDQKGRPAPSVPDKGRAMRAPMGRSQIRSWPVVSAAVNAMKRPSGDTLGVPISTISGPVGMENWIDS